MKVKQNKIIAIVLFIVLIGFSFLKDNFSPDYYNSPAALFLKPAFGVGRFASLHTQPLFWITAICYSLLFIFLPYLILHYYFENKMLSKYTLILLVAMCVSIYLMIFMNSAMIDKAIIPKINRYFHSPIMTMFFIASFTILPKVNQK